MRKIFFASQYKHKSKKSYKNQTATKNTPKYLDKTGKQINLQKSVGIKKLRNYKKKVGLFGISTKTQVIKDFILLKRILRKHISEMGIKLSEAVIRNERKTTPAN